MYAMRATQQRNARTTQYDQGRMGHGNYRGRGRGGVIGRGQGPITCYIYNQQGHISRDCNRPNFTCVFCKSREHVIEDFPTLLQRIQEKRPQITNQNIQLIITESPNEALDLNIIMRSGLNIEDIPEQQQHHPNAEWV